MTYKFKFLIVALIELVYLALEILLKPPIIFRVGEPLIFIIGNIIIGLREYKKTPSKKLLRGIIIGNSIGVILTIWWFTKIILPHL